MHKSNALLCFLCYGIRHIDDYRYTPPIPKDHSELNLELRIPNKT